MIQKIDGFKFKIRKNDSSDLEVIREILIEKEYSQGNFKIKENDTVIDIGAHIGIFSIFAAKAAKNGKVYAYEPFPENFKLLKENCGLNNVKNIFSFKQAVSGTQNNARLYLNKCNCGHSFYGKSKKHINVNCTTMEEIFESNKINFCDFLKIDCEGGEYEILLNTPERYLHRTDMIALEYHDSLSKKRLLKKLINYLGKMGFKIKIVHIIGTRGILYAKNNHPRNFIEKITIKISNCFEAHKLFKFPRHFLLEVDQNIGKAGIFIKKYSPKTYSILRIPIKLIKGIKKT